MLHILYIFLQRLDSFDSFCNVEIFTSARVFSLSKLNSFIGPGGLRFSSIFSGLRVLLNILRSFSSMSVNSRIITGNCTALVSNGCYYGNATSDESTYMWAFCVTHTMDKPQLYIFSEDRNSLREERRGDG